MTAYNSSEKGSPDYNLFMMLSMVLAKNKCSITEIDLEHGILDISGNSPEAEKICQYDMQKAFAKYLFR